MFRRQQSKRFHAQSFWKVIELPNLPLITTATLYLQRADPTHHPGQIAKKNISGFNAFDSVVHPFTKTAYTGSVIAKFLPCLSGKEVEPIRHSETIIPDHPVACYCAMVPMGFYFTIQNNVT